MKKMMNNPKLSRKLMQNNPEYRQMVNDKAASRTPAHNAQADPTIVPPSEEERRRRRGTIINPTDKLG